MLLRQPEIFWIHPPNVRYFDASSFQQKCLYHTWHGDFQALDAPDGKLMMERCTAAQCVTPTTFGETRKTKGEWS